MRTFFACVTVAGLVAAANAQSTTRVIFEASLDNGASWYGGRISPSFGGPGNVNVEVRARIVLNGTDTVLGLAGITFQPKMTGVSAADIPNPFTSSDGSGVTEEPQSNTGRIFPFASSGMGTASASGLLTSFVDGGNTLRFAGAHAVTQTTNLAWGVSSGQTPRVIATSDFRSGTDVVVFRYSVNLRIDSPQATRELSATTDIASILQGRASGIGRMQERNRSVPQFQQVTYSL